MIARITDVVFAAAGARDARRGLLGIATVHLDSELAIHHVAVRRTRDGRDALSFPASNGPKGQRRRALVHPLGRAAHAEFEREVFAWLRRSGKVAP